MSKCLDGIGSQLRATTTEFWLLVQALPVASNNFHRTQSLVPCIQYLRNDSPRRQTIGLAQVPTCTCTSVNLNRSNPICGIKGVKKHTVSASATYLVFQTYEYGPRVYGKGYECGKFVFTAPRSNGRIE